MPRRPGRSGRAALRHPPVSVGPDLSPRTAYERHRVPGWMWALRGVDARGRKPVEGEGRDTPGLVPGAGHDDVGVGIFCFCSQLRLTSGKLYRYKARRGGIRSRFSGAARPAAPFSKTPLETDGKGAPSALRAQSGARTAPAQRRARARAIRAKQGPPLPVGQGDRNDRNRTRPASAATGQRPNSGRGANAGSAASRPPPPSPDGPGTPPP